MHDDYPNTLISIAWHSPNYSPDPAYVIPEYNTRAAFYGVGGIPHTQWNGIESTVGGYPNANWQPMYNSFINIYNSMINNNSPFIMQLSVGGTGNLGMYDITLTMDYSYATNNHNLEVFVIEDHIPSYWTAVGIWEDARFVARDWLPSTTLTISQAGETQTFSGTFTIDDSWDLSQVGIVAIVQDMTTKEVKQADMAYISLANYLFLYGEFIDITGDDDLDGILNPGESVTIILTAVNESVLLNATNIVGTISTSGAVTIPNPEILFGDLEAGGEIAAGEVGIFLDPDIPLGEVQFTLLLTADYEDMDGKPMQYSREFYFSLNVSLNQAGWPHYVGNQVESSPIIFDINGDDINEIIFGDYGGLLHVVTPNGAEVDGFPFDLGNQIWGSPAVADIDNDGDVEIIIGSKNKHLYVLNADGSVQVNYNAGQYLMGTPALGDIDGDSDLEIIFGGYSSPGKIFAVNPDGSDVIGFPLQLGEKIQRGVALADFNNNGKVDIVCGTDGENINLIYDDGTLADGFPFETGNDIRMAPSILDLNGEKIIFAGSRDNSFYAINSDGSLRFELVTGGDVSTSPGFVATENGTAIFIGSDDGYLYGIRTDGTALPGWPQHLGNDVIASPAFADLDGDGESEVVSATAAGNLFAFHLDGNPYAHFPISNDTPFKGSPTIIDTDLDGDLEILIGCLGSLVNIDVKETGNKEGCWHLYRGNQHRTGYYLPTLETESVSVNHLAEWNLVGLPVIVEDPYHLTVFPDAIEGTLYFFNGGYVQENDLISGSGYWLRFAEAGLNTITGIPLSSLSISLIPEWNLISGISNSVNIYSIDDPDGLIIPGTFYEFTGGYQQTEILEPGKGYWVRSGGSGDITISNNQVARRSDFVNRLENANIISFNGYYLYFGVNIPEDEILSYTLPPPPPQGAFDVRFEGDWKICGPECNDGPPCVIEIMNNTDSLVITYEINNEAGAGMDWVLINSSSGNSVALVDSGEIIIEAVSELILTKTMLSITDEHVNPVKFSLYQNFPNPFNPVTTIQYYLPSTSDVSLIIYDLQGHEIARLDEGELSAGHHSVIWDATDYSSGVYFMKLSAGQIEGKQAGRNVLTKKIMLIK